MYEALAELQELKEFKEMTENIRRSVNALELCWSCQRISECEQALLDDAAPVWLCTTCRESFSAGQPLQAGARFWPRK